MMSGTVSCSACARTGTGSIKKAQTGAIAQTTRMYFMATHMSSAPKTVDPISAPPEHRFGATYQLLLAPD
jgi:hypothetical protein